MSSPPATARATQTDEHKQNQKDNTASQTSILACSKKIFKRHEAFLAKVGSFFDELVMHSAHVPTRASLLEHTVLGGLAERTLMHANTFCLVAAVSGLVVVSGTQPAILQEEYLQPIGQNDAAGLPLLAQLLEFMLAIASFEVVEAGKQRKLLGCLGLSSSGTGEGDMAIELRRWCVPGRFSRCAPLLLL